MPGDRGGAPRKAPRAIILGCSGERLTAEEGRFLSAADPVGFILFRRNCVTPEQIGDDLPLFGPDGLGLDSIDALELVVSMEKTFGVGVPSSDVAGKALRTVNTIHDYILEKREAVA